MYAKNKEKGWRGEDVIAEESAYLVSGG